MDAPGDNVLAEFPTALDAVRCAVEIQGVLRALNASLPDERRMDFRIGVHMGDVATDEERVYGVNIAARLEALAEAGGVCIPTGRARRAEAADHLRPVLGPLLPARHRRAQHHVHAGRRLSVV